MRGVSLVEDDVTALHELVGLAGEEPGVALPWPFLHRLQRLIRCDQISVSGMVTSERRHYLGQTIEDDAESATSAGAPGAEPEPDAFWEHYWHSIPCSYPDTTHDYTRITKLSDFHSSRAWHATGMYLDYLGPEGIEQELMMCLPDGAGRSLRLLCFRGPGQDFGERERFLLELLRPHVAEAYRAAVHLRHGARELTARQLEILELVRTGCTNRQIARHTGLSEATVRTHLNNIFTRLDVTSRTAAVARLGSAPI